MAKLSEMSKDDRKLALNTMWSEIKSETEINQPIDSIEDPLNPFWSINFACAYSEE